MKPLNSVGASHVALIAVVAVLAVVGFAGYRVAGKTPSVKPVSNAATTQSTKYKTQADVKNASKQLDSTNVDQSLDFGSLDSDLNDLL